VTATDENCFINEVGKTKYFSYISRNRYYPKMAEKKDRTWFWIFTGLIVALIIIFVAQNHHPVQMQFLIINMRGPGFLVFLMVFAMGVLAGWGWEYFRRSKRQSNNYPHKDSEHQGH
jgi:uncharacterized integral membrane protein